MDKLVQKAVDDQRVTIWVNTTHGSTETLSNYLLNAGWGVSGGLICFVHANDTAARQAAETKSSVQSADSVASYSVLFETSSLPKTKILHTSACLLIQEALADPLLSRYSVVIIAEYHLRILETDLILGLLKKILKKRNDIHILIAGATQESLDALSIYLPDAKILSLNTPTYTVDLHSIPVSTDNYITAALETVLSLFATHDPGNTVVFLPSREGYELKRRLEDSSWSSSGPPNLQLINSLPELERFESDVKNTESTSYVIITSLRAGLVARYMPVAIVIDSGFQELRYSLYGLATLARTQQISQETANQRTRIAGLSTPGKCYRLYPQDQFDNFQKTETPEIQRACLDRSILQLKSLGVDNILRFDYLSPPLTSMVAEALDRLVAIGAMNESAELTKPFGERLAQLPLKLLHGAMLLRSLERGCFDQIISLIAVRLSKGGFFDHEKSRLFVAQEGDDITWLNIYEGFIKSGSAPARGNWCQKHGLSEQRLLKAVDIRNQLLRILQHRGIKTAKSELATSTTITQCIADVYKHNSAFRVSNGLFRTTIGSLDVRIHPSSVLYNRNPGFIVFEEVVENDGKLFVKDITTIQRDRISEK
ncbi:hypothetical protein TWF569_011462 [Orbilia oligospora]|uniref:Helicase ATP-binding domain-containing protein n=1 Tax=Orbilia oligospora TaxID=2813651 RepID=A0A7C8J367_ORBOL|nr:hypothetical protein TWF706_010711 [Orbilia oligospora]KAF3091068.1 hypothetical protein TWF102_008943 [Orbilia oligospora]KAF3097881.1 hypothetical protein TWF103_009265 [Orbilia oligospora]KAF3131153.1 hypothetical protein TWF569_011462 [Orbilia oligospora]KAF3131743.1 hypothetical protein TWF594_009765 [Orbilia oligospora]